MNYLFDTDILVDILRGEQSIALKIRQIGIILGDISISTLTVFELMEGAYLSNSESELATTINIINGIRNIEINREIASEAGKISSLLKRKGRAIGVGDILIGATAIAGNRTLVTRNIKHFSHIPNLKIIEW